jgi:hypothetical protein
VQDNYGWRIEGPEKDRARIAYAAIDGDRIVYTLDAAPRTSLQS